MYSCVNRQIGLFHPLILYIFSALSISAHVSLVIEINTFSTLKLILVLSCLGSNKAIKQYT